MNGRKNRSGLDGNVEPSLNEPPLSFAGAAPKERKALGAISGNTQLAGDKPAKRPSKKSSGVPAASKSDLVVFEEGEQAAPKVPHRTVPRRTQQRSLSQARPRQGGGGGIV